MFKIRRKIKVETIRMWIEMTTVGYNDHSGLWWPPCSCNNNVNTFTSFLANSNSNRSSSDKLPN